MVVTNARAGHKLNGQAPREGKMSYLEQEAESQALSSGRERASVDQGKTRYIPVGNTNMLFQTSG